MAMVDTLKKINRAAAEAGAPMQIMFGTVTSADPLTVSVDNRFTVSASMLIVPKELREGYITTHKHTIGEVGETWTDKEYCNGLEAGEAVILLRDAGGQRFLIVGRV